MPYRSEKQRRFMHWKHPEIAKRWDREYGGKIVPKKKKKKDKKAATLDADLLRVAGMLMDAGHDDLAERLLPFLD